MIGDLFQPMHLLIILVIAVIVFGPGKLPELGNALGKALRDFKKEVGGSEKSPPDRAANQKIEKRS